MNGFWAIFCLFAIFCGVFCQEHRFREASIDRNVELLIVGFRHANRNPENFIREYLTAGLGSEGELELTDKGKSMAYYLGRSLRDRYSNLIPQQFDKKQVKAISSSASRAYLTTNLVLAGIFPNGAPIQPQPAPGVFISAFPIEVNDPVVRMYKVPCAEYDRTWNPVSNDDTPRLERLERDNKTLIDYVAENTGLPATISTMADVADNVWNMRELNQMALPLWVTNSRMDGKIGQDIYPDIIKYMEAHPINGASRYGSAKILGGPFLNDIMNRLDKKKDGDSPDLDLVVYGSHSEVVLSAVNMMKLENIHETPPTAGFAIEMKRTPEPQIRVLFHVLDRQSDPQNRHFYVATPSPDGSDWMRLEDFDLLVSRNRVRDWKSYCSRFSSAATSRSSIVPLAISLVTLAIFKKAFLA